MASKRPTNSRTKTVERIQTATGKENDITFEDESSLLRKSAAENFFMQGKNIEINKARRGKRFERNDSTSDVEDVNSEKPNKFSLQNISNYIENDSNKKDMFIVNARKNFGYYTNVYLGSEFNICFIGAGYKNCLIEEYNQYLISVGKSTFSADGFNEEFSMRAMLQALYDRLNLRKDTGRDIVAWAKRITEELGKKQKSICLLLHNIDSVDLRDPNDQRALAALCSTQWIRLVTSIDHLKATMMWDSDCCSLLNFVFVEANSFKFSLPNLMASKSSILGLNPKNSTATHTVASLDILWQSLAENAKKIFRIFFAMAFDSKHSVPFWDLFTAARDDFLVSSDAALRQLLVEFEDHHVLNRRRREDGNENLIPCIEKQLIEKFLAEKGISLDL